MRKYFIVFSLLLSFHSEAQLTISDFLSTAKEDIRLQQWNESLGYLESKPYRLSPIQRLEFRTQNRELEPTQQEFALRVTPGNPWEIRNNNRYFKSYRNLMEVERELVQQEAFKDRYHAAIDYFICSEQRMLMQQVYDNISQQLAILEKQIGTDYFDADDYMDSQLDLVETSADLHAEMVTQSVAMRRIRFLANNASIVELPWQRVEFISVERIIQVVDSLGNRSLSILSQSYQQERARVAQAQYKLEKSNINAGFIQAEYDNRRVEQERVPFNIALGVTIPIFNPNKPDMAERRLDEIEASNELAEEKLENKYMLDALKQQISENALAYKKINDQLDKLTNSPVGKTLSQLKGSDPRVMVKFYGSTLKLKEVQLKLYRLILTDYIEYIAQAGGLEVRPAVNFLSNDLPPLD
jgi:hypothetical protein